MELRILGPLEVVTHDRVGTPSVGKQRSLLAFLILHANERVGADRLIDALWGERPPATAPAALQNQVTKLRRLLGAERIETDGSTYLLHVAPGELDVHQFEELVRRAGTAAAVDRAELLRSALALWRGRPLGDIDELFAQPEIARLEELRLVAIEERLDAELELGESAALVPELEALAREHPLREGIRAKLMLALYRCGRQADALEVYHHVRGLLVDELGIEPQQQLQSLHRQILLQDAGLDVTPSEAEPTGATEDAESLTPAAPREVRKSVTAAFVSIQLPATGDPELLRALEERATATVRLAAERHGGHVQEQTGAGTLVVFGVPVLHEDDAMRAVRAADEVRTALSELNPELRLRAGVATGVVIAATEAAGEPVQAARELERRAEGGEILLAPSTQRLVRDAVACEQAGEGALRLVRLDPTAQGVTRRLDAPLVDRERELLLLETAFSHAVQSSACQVFTVCGEAGIGKSRLVAELLTTVGDEATVLAAQCLAYGEGITYWPVVEIIRDAAGIGADDPVDARERIAALVPGAESEVVADRLAGLLGLGPPPTADEIAWAVRRLLEALAAVRPVVVVVDDLQYAEPTLLDLLEGLADRSHGAPILLAGLARPSLLESRPTWGGGKPNTMTISLEPLDAHDSGLLLANLPGGSELDPELSARVVQAAGGHPFFVEELLTMLSEQGRTLGGDDELTLPPTVQALLGARLERLPDAERLVLDCGSIEGETFHTAALAALEPLLEPGALEDALVGLLRKNLVRPAEPQLPGGDAFRFRHALVREEAYAALPKARRAALHEAFAAWLEEAGAQRLAELEEMIAFHLEQAFRLWQELGSLDRERRALGERAGRLLASAGDRAYQRSDMPAAANLLGRAAELLPTDDEQRLRLMIDLGSVLRAGGEFERADAVLAEAARRAGETGQRATQAHAELERALLGTHTDAAHGMEQLERTAAALVADPAAAEDRVAVARALCMLGVAHWNRLESDKAAELFLEARVAAAEAGTRRVEAVAQVFLALTFLTGPMPIPGALAALGELLPAVSGDPYSEGSLLIYSGALESMQGRFGEARELLAQGAERLDDLGQRVLRASTDYWAVLAELDAGDPVAAEQIARSAVETLSAVGDRWNATFVASALAEALHRQGRDEEAEQQLAFAAEVDPGQLLHHAPVSTTKAKVLARRGEAAAAIALARATIASLAPTDALVLRGDAQLGLCEALAAAGELDEAASAAAEAIVLYNTKGASALAARAVARQKLLRTP